MEVEEQSVFHHDPNTHTHTLLALSFYSQPHLLGDRKRVTSTAEKAHACI